MRKLGQNDIFFKYSEIQKNKYILTQFIMLELNRVAPSNMPSILLTFAVFQFKFAGPTNCPAFPNMPLMEVTFDVSCVLKDKVENRNIW